MDRPAEPGSESKRRSNVAVERSLDEALAMASEELGLEPWYRDEVKPLVESGPDGWPTCCGGGCEPCVLLLIAVAKRTLALMNGASVV